LEYRKKGLNRLFNPGRVFLHAEAAPQNEEVKDHVTECGTVWAVAWGICQV
jgi:hypothetical protein